MIFTLLGKKLSMPRWIVPPAPLTGATSPCGVIASSLTNSLLEPPENNTPTSSWLLLPESVLALLVGGQTVATTLRHVSQVFVLAACREPRQEMYSPKLSLAFTRLHHSCKDEDPAPKLQSALPVSIIEDAMTNEGASSNPTRTGLLLI